MKSLTILGSTGSIGTNALSIVQAFPERFKVNALTAHTRVESLARQIVTFHPNLAAVVDEDHARRLKALLPDGSKVKIVFGEKGFVEAATLEDTDMVLGAMVGAAGLVPTLAAIDNGKEIALANKETLVMAGGLVMERVRSRGVKLMPVDSEHSAIFQSLEGHSHNRVQEILLTASGGPFRKRPVESFDEITPEDALNHPNWSMGSKITIDSATLMNKGLEVVEAKWLFDVAFRQIKILVHPQSIVHSMVTYADGAVIAQMGIPDMKGAIAYGLSHPDRLPIGVPPPDFFQIGNLTFEKPDLNRFPCLGLAFQAGERGQTYPAVLNAANEMAVAAFLDRRLPFVRIANVIESVLDLHETEPGNTLEQILEADRWARETADRLIRKQER